MPQIIQVTSEAIQAQIRRLLPSQQGFGIDMEASSVITPVIDVTPAAEGSQLPTELRMAASAGNITTTSIVNTATTTTVVDTPAFYKYNATLSILTNTTGAVNRAQVIVSDGFVGKILHELRNSAATGDESPMTISVSGVCYLREGESFNIATAGTDCYVRCSAWPVADVNGNLTNPAGFTFE